MAWPARWKSNDRRLMSEMTVRSRNGWGLQFVLVPMLLVTGAGSLQMRRGPVASSETVEVGGASIQVDFAEGPLDLGYPVVVARLKDAAHAVEVYFGRFPV